MRRAAVERRLFEVSARLSRARAELAVLDEQAEVLDDAAEDAKLRSLVSELPQASRVHLDARRHAESMARARAALRRNIAGLERTQEDLIGRLTADL